MRRWEEVIRDIAREGFLRRNSVSKDFAERLTDPMFVNPPARLCRISGVRPAHRGGVKFSTIDFFGKELSHGLFMVINDEKFNAWVGSSLEAMFRAENPHPESRLAAAFTHYMHESNLHWSGCTERKQNNDAYR